MNFLLYDFFKFIFKLALRFFFSKVEIKGSENIPEKGPMIIVANHPATFLDPIVIGVQLKVRVSFLAKAVIFENKYAAKFLSYFNVIPVYRPQDDPSQVGKNEHTFKACYSYLGKGGTLMIFPEGISQTVRQLQKIKTGTARIALGAEELNDFSLGLKILPIGLNYSNQEKFQSRLFMSIDSPIVVKDFEKAFHHDNIEGVRLLTGEIESRINNQIINAGNEQIDTLVRRIERLMKAQVLKDWGVSRDELEKDYLATKRIAEAVNYFQQKDPALFSRVEGDLNEYFERLNEVDLPENIFISRRLSMKSLFLYVSYFLIGLPFFLFGFLNNIIPYKISRVVAQLSSGLKEYRGAIGLAAGTFIFLGFYFLEFFAVYKILGEILLPVLYVVAAPFLGIFSFYYWRKVKRFYYKVVFAFSRKKFLIRNLLAARSRIIQELERARREFLEEAGETVL